MESKNKKQNKKQPQQQQQTSNKKNNKQTNNKQKTTTTTTQGNPDTGVRDVDYLLLYTPSRHLSHPLLHPFLVITRCDEQSTCTFTFHFYIQVNLPPLSSTLPPPHTHTHAASCVAKHHMRREPPTSTPSTQHPTSSFIHATLCQLRRGRTCTTSCACALHLIRSNLPVASTPFLPSSFIPSLPPCCFPLHVKSV